MSATTAIELEPKSKPTLNLNPKLKKMLNSVARKNGFSVATHYVVEKRDEIAIGKTLPYGYRKNTTGEYVPKKYVNNFGWKNTYYQHAIVIAKIPKLIFDSFCNK